MEALEISEGKTYPLSTWQDLSNVTWDDPTSTAVEDFEEAGACVPVVEIDEFEEGGREGFKARTYYQFDWAAGPIKIGLMYHYQLGTTEEMKEALFYRAEQAIYRRVLDRVKEYNERSQ